MLEMLETENKSEYQAFTHRCEKIMDFLEAQGKTTPGRGHNHIPKQTKQDFRFP